MPATDKQLRHHTKPKQKAGQLLEMLASGLSCQLYSGKCPGPQIGRSFRPYQPKDACQHVIIVDLNPACLQYVWTQMPGLTFASKQL